MPRRRTRKGEESSARLLRAAAAEFARVGYHDAKVSDIVAAAGLTQAAFYQYYPSKEEVFAQLVNSFRERVTALADTGKLVTPLPSEAVPAQVRANVEGLFRFLAADPDLTRIGLFADPDADEVKRQMAALIAANLRANQAAGHIRPDVVPEVMGEFLVGAVERLTVRFLLTGEKAPDVLAGEVYQSFLYGVLNHR